MDSTLGGQTTPPGTTPPSKETVPAPSEEPVIDSVSTQSDQSEHIEHDHSGIVALLLVYLYPIGVILMFIWMKKWSGWIKFLLVLPLFFGIISLFAISAIIGMVFNKSATGQFPIPLNEALECQQQCAAETNQQTCIESCLKNVIEEFTIDSKTDSNGTMMEKDSMLERESTPSGSGTQTP